MHRFLLHNDSIRETTEPCLSPGQVGFLNGWGVFSTLRVADGVLFAWERHWARMVRDAKRLHIPMPENPEALRVSLGRLIAANEAQNGTLRVAIVRNHGGMFEAPDQTRRFDVVAFSTGLRTWGGSARLMIQADARQGGNPFRGAKITAWAHNLTWYEMAHDRGYDEVVLLDEAGRVSECTSANLFAVFGSEVITPSLDCGCLPGITREILLEEIRVEGITIREGTLRLEDLERADGVFMTSSTRDLLPVTEVEGLRLGQDTAVTGRLLGAFRAHIHEYVASRRTAAVISH
ncbi:MAG TPA: aminotransferase class IV [Bryobacteraceae bacterium]|nr:aminotransferase class IV [Bryobacteraceae bacterium]